MNPKPESLLPRVTVPSKGIVPLNSELKSPNPNPILLVGAARGGTSFLSSVCHHLGLPMGGDGPFYENWFLQKAVNERDWELVAQLSDALSAFYPRWGWKLPALGNNLEKVDSVFSNHRYIFIMRNPVSVYWTKRRLHLSEDPGAEILKVSNLYSILAQFSRTSKVPILFVSLEDAMANLLVSIQAIADFCELRPKKIQEIAVRVQRDRDHYGLELYPEAPPRSELNDRLYGLCRDRGYVLPGYASDELPSASPIEAKA